MSHEGVLYIKRNQSGKFSSALKLRNKHIRKDVLVNRLSTRNLVLKAYNLDFIPPPIINSSPHIINGDIPPGNQPFLSDNSLNPLTPIERKRIYFLINNPRDVVENKLKEYFINSRSLKYEISDKKTEFYLRLFNRITRNKLKKAFKTCIETSTNLTDFPVALISNYLGIGKLKSS